MNNFFKGEIWSNFVPVNINVTGHIYKWRRWSVNVLGFQVHWPDMAVKQAPGGGGGDFLAGLRAIRILSVIRVYIKSRNQITN